ncbi:hypothetical protein KI387_000360, partial [Taxus chinensis]
GTILKVTVKGTIDVSGAIDDANAAVITDVGSSLDTIGGKVDDSTTEMVLADSEV